MGEIADTTPYDEDIVTALIVAIVLYVIEASLYMWRRKKRPQ